MVLISALARRIVLLAMRCLSLSTMDLCLTGNPFVSWGHRSHRNPNTCVSGEEETMLTLRKHRMALKHGGLDCFSAFLKFCVELF